MNLDTNWHIFKGDNREPHNTILGFDKKVPPPIWRSKDSSNLTYIPTPEEIESVNAAIYLRRPLLLTGRPGTGKSSLAYAIAKELNLEVLHWAINSKTTLEDGLYQYDAISRLYDSQRGDEKDIEEYVSLGALGKAFAKEEKTVLLIDELDKSDIDLPNDLLHILEENEFEIPVLKRYKKKDIVNLGTEKSKIFIEKGKKKISSSNLPIIIITSNQERDFPPAFMRRCLYHHIDLPLYDRLTQIANKHLEKHYDKKSDISKEKWKETIESLVKEFLDKREGKGEYKQKSELSTDQLLNAIYLRLKGKVDISKSEILKSSLWHSLDS